MKEQTNAQSIHLSAQKAKLPWTKPTLTFMPLQVTANSSGTGQDALTAQINVGG